MIPNQAENNILNELLRDPAKVVTARLFQNNPAAADDACVLASFVECDFDGYAAVDDAIWAAPATNGDGDGETLSSVMHFERAAGSGGNQTTYGIFLTFTGFDTTEKLLWFTRFGTPFIFDSVGAFLEKTVSFTDRQKP